MKNESEAANTVSHFACHMLLEKEPKEGHALRNVVSRFCCPGPHRCFGSFGPRSYPKSVRQFLVWAVETSYSKDQSELQWAVKRCIKDWEGHLETKRVQRGTTDVSALAPLESTPFSKGIFTCCT